MTVAELIEELEKYPPELEVGSCDGMGLSGEPRVYRYYDTVWVSA